tara:strand:- start:111 stop:224 length:114 start_codon:yes stop_codon:yes gene_type:complete
VRLVDLFAGLNGDGGWMLPGMLAVVLDQIRNLRLAIQ